MISKKHRIMKRHKKRLAKITTYKRHSLREIESRLKTSLYNIDRDILKDHN